MPITVQIPSSLRAECGGSSQLELRAATVHEALEVLQRTQPGLYQSVCDETGTLRKHMNLFVNDSLLSRRDGPQTELHSGDTLYIMTAVSGG
ncbi:MoaD/ThiS family protein [Blastopirellula marina]|uniref:Molybdopterin synthase sulfur carrier subunit n=1 Tax=Blastopirellula marina TaxID=124 RepID=A0A2S8FP84_9BACT|nr:MoaD/ThiS family protein [Blastopirellula marina]PQO33993.1 molybdopterin synthase sulfur carrier subunit [Blastopirellula marina]PTL43779.1 MoaD/ThiS family protein [Blastopirellula marina]